MKLQWLCAVQPYDISEVQNNALVNCSSQYVAWLAVKPRLPHSVSAVASAGLADWCSTNGRLQMLPRWWAPHRPVRCSGNKLLEDCRTAGRQCAGAPSCTNHQWIPVPRLSAYLEECFVGNRGEPPRSDVVENSMVPEVCLQHCWALKIKLDTLRIFFSLQEAVSGNLASEGLLSCNIFFLNFGVDSSVGF